MAEERPPGAPTFTNAVVVAVVAALGVYLTLRFGCDVAADFVLLRDACEANHLALALSAGAGCALIGAVAVVAARRRNSGQ